MKKSKRPEEWEARLGTSGFNPLEVFDLIDAVKAKKKIANIQGRQFKLSYHTFQGNACVHYSPVDGFVPMGDIQIDKLLRGF